MLTSIKDRVSSKHEHVRIVKFEYRALRAPQNMIRASGYPSMLGARPIPTYSREPFFSKVEKKFVAPPKSITNDVYFTLLEGNIHFMSNKLVRAHFHFYIIYKLKNEMVHIINCLDSSVGRAIGSDPEG